jgi:hypothetical protein
VPLDQHAQPTATITPQVESVQPIAEKRGFFAKFGRLFKK